MSRGEREPSVPCPLLSPPPDGGNATPCHGEHPPAREGQSRLQRRTAVPAEGIPSANGQKGDGKNSELTLAEKGELFYNKINTWEDFL